MSDDAARLLHVKTYGPGGSYPKALCGYAGAGTSHRMTTTSARLARETAARLLPVCAACLALLDEVEQ